MDVSHRCLFITFGFTLLGAVSTAQGGIVLLEDFEDGTIGYTSTLGDPGSSNGADSYFGRVGPTGISTSDFYNNIDGSGYFGAQNTADDPSIGGGTLVWTGIDITGLSQLEFSASFAESGDGWDPNSQVLVQTRIDGAGSFSGNEIFALQSGSDTVSNTSAFVDTDFDGIGDGTEITTTFQRLSTVFPVNGSTLDLKILIFGLTESGEKIAFDTVALSTVPEPASMALMGMTLCGVVGTRIRRRRKDKNAAVDDQ